MNAYIYFLIWMVLVKLLWPLPYLNCLLQQSSHCVPLALFPHGYHHLLHPQTLPFMLLLSLSLWLSLGSLLQEELHLSSVKVGCLICSRVKGVSDAPYQLVFQQTITFQHSCKRLLFQIMPFMGGHVIHSFIPFLITTAYLSLNHSLHLLNAHVLSFLPAQLSIMLVTVTFNFLFSYFLRLLIINILYFNSVSVLECAISWNCPPWKSNSNIPLSAHSSYFIWLHPLTILVLGFKTSCYLHVSLMSSFPIQVRLYSLYVNHFLPSIL